MDKLLGVVKLKPKGGVKVNAALYEAIAVAYGSK
jgi:hypothetical protein